MSNQHAEAQSSMGRSFNSPRVMWAMAFVSMVATLLVNGMPVVIGTLGDAYGIPNDQLGVLASAFLVGKFVVVCSSLFWVRRTNWRRISLIGMLSGLVLLTTLILSPSHNAFLIAFVLLGAAMACFYVPVLAYWSDVDDPARVVSIGILLQVGGAAVFMYAMPAWVVPTWGVKGLVGFLIGVMLVNLLVVPLIPQYGRKGTSDDDAGSTSASLTSPAVVLPLFGLFVMTLYYIGLFGMWAFMERIGTSSGLSPELAASALSISLLAGTGAVVVTSIVGDRYGYVKPIVLSAVLYGLFLSSMSLNQSMLLFLSAVIIFNLAWNGALPYQLGLIAKSDSTGKFFVLLPAFQAAGAAGGPFFAGMLSADGSYRNLYFVFVASVAVSFFSYLWIALRLRSDQAEKAIASTV